MHHRKKLVCDLETVLKKMIFLCGCYVREEGGLTTRKSVPKERSSNLFFHQSISCKIKREEAMGRGFYGVPQ